MVIGMRKDFLSPNWAPIMRTYLQRILSVPHAQICVSSSVECLPGAPAKILFGSAVTNLAVSAQIFCVPSGKRRRANLFHRHKHYWDKFQETTFYTKCILVSNWQKNMTLRTVSHYSACTETIYVIAHRSHCTICVLRYYTYGFVRFPLRRLFVNQQ
jgi:hypothetical protein